MTNNSITSSSSSSHPISTTTTASEQSRYLLILDELEDMKIQYDGAKRVFRMFMVQSGMDWRALNVFKCCGIMRRVLLEAHFRIVATGESVKFEDVPIPGYLVKQKKSSSKKLFSRRRRGKSYSFEQAAQAAPDVDPLVAQLPHTVQQQSSSGQLQTRAQIESRKDMANVAISRYTDIVQRYHNYRTLFEAAAEISPALGKSKYGAILEMIQDEVNMSVMVLTGNCCPLPE